MAFGSFPSGTDNFTPHQRIMHRVSLGSKIDRVDVLPPDHGTGWIFKVEIDYDRHDDIRQRVFFDRIDDCSLIGAIEEAIDRYDLPACRDDFGVCAREGWAIWERVEDGD
jgi:hypothetical protein